jgi:hypothetical protein
VSERETAPAQGLPQGLAGRLDPVLDRFEQAWKAGARPRLEDFLPAVDEADRPALLEELLALDLEYRGRAGERPTAEEYRLRLPGQAELVGDFFAGLCPTGVGGGTGGGEPPVARAVRAGPVRVPGYEELEEIGRGGMGVVYKARQITPPRIVALKMVLVGRHAGPAALARFKAEAEIVARLQHPNIVSVFEVGEHDGLPFFSLEYCPGGSLDRKQAGTPMPPLEAARLVEVLARAVQHAHEQGVIHRDLKPANVLLAADGTPKITDFGLARQLDQQGRTATGAVLGTPSYMSPEQAAGRNKEVGPATDVYALAVILYELITGRPPFRGDSALEVLHQVCACEPAPPRQLQPLCPRDLETICLKGLEKSPRKRYASARELADDLRRLQEGRPIRARHVGRFERALLWALRHPTRAAVYGVTALLLLLMGLTTLTYHTGRRDLEAVEGHLTAQAEESNRVTARLVANVVQENIQDRIEHLEGLRDENSAALRAALRRPPPAEDDPQLLELLRRFHARGASRMFFRSYAVADRTGRLRARYIGDRAPGRKLSALRGPRSFRDWFNGQGDQPGRELPPIHGPHVSQPYVPRMTDQLALAVNVSVPLFDRGTRGEVVGVLTGRIAVRDLYAWLEGVDVRDGFVVLLNERGHCLLHRERKRIEPAANVNPTDWRGECPLYEQALRERRDGKAIYRDPIDGKEYLAGYAPFPERGERGAGAPWVALVQQERASVLRPLDDLRGHRRIRLGLSLSAGGLMLAALWGWLFLAGRGHAPREAGD